MQLNNMPEHCMQDRYNNVDAREQMQEYLRHTMGEDFFLLCRDFFESVWQSGASYKVFLARRCMNLMYMFYLCEDANIKSDSLEKTFFSDGALLSNVHEIACAYRDTQTVPRILIVDEILIHGRTFNKLITDFVEGLYDCLTEDGAQLDKAKLEADVFAAISIRVIMQNDMKLLLYSRYRSLVKSVETCSMQKWHQFSSCVSKAIADGVVTNTSYVPSMHLRLLQKAERVFLYRHLSEQADKVATAFPYRRRFLEKAWVYPVTTPSGDVKAIYTLRVVTSEIDGSKTVIPFVLLSNIKSFQNKLFSYLDNNTRAAAEQAYRYWGPESPASMESFVLILSQNLLLLLLQDCGINNWDKCFDYEKIKMSFRSMRTQETETFYTMIKNRVSPWFTWEQMEEMILELTNDSTPLFLMKRYNDIGTIEGSEHTKYMIRHIEETAQDLFASYGYQAEYHAFMQQIGKEFPPGSSVPYNPISDVLNELDQKVGYEASRVLSRKDFLVCAIAVLLRYMDMGALAVASSYDKDTESFCDMCRAGEQSLFILPQRYSLYLPVLARMEQDCLGDLEWLIRIMRKFFLPRNDNQILDKLIAFVRDLYGMGQCLYDWDINLSSWLEWEEKEEYVLWEDPDEIKKRNIKTLFKEIAGRNKLLNEYMEQ